MDAIPGITACLNKYMSNNEISEQHVTIFAKWFISGFCFDAHYLVWLLILLERMNYEYIYITYTNWQLVIGIGLWLIHKMDQDNSYRISVLVEVFNRYFRLLNLDRLTVDDITQFEIIFFAAANYNMYVSLDAITARLAALRLT